MAPVIGDWGCCKEGASHEGLGELPFGNRMPLRGGRVKSGCSERAGREGKAKVWDGYGWWVSQRFSVALTLRHPRSLERLRSGRAYAAVSMAGPSTAQPPKGAEAAAQDDKPVGLADTEDGRWEGDGEGD